MSTTRHTPGASEPPARLGRYRLVRCISSGGMARVYEARRESLAGVAPKVAVKVILPEYAADETFQQLFVNEARIVSQLQHQNLVQIQDFDREAGHFYLVMEYVEGITLRRAASLCRRNGMPIPLAVIAELGRQISEGLHYAHTARSEDGQRLRLVHRDIKPSNLILNAQGVVKVLDFGISKALIAAERRGTVKGTWGYMAPEQAAAHDVDAAADQYGLACVLYELAMLKPLFGEKEPRELRRLMNEDEGARRANRLAGPHAPLVPVLLRALQRDPRARFQDASQMALALGRLTADPVLAREQVLNFHHTVSQLAQGQTPEPRRSASTMSRAPSQPSQASQASAGLPLSAGDAHGPRPGVPIGPPPPLPKPRSPWTMGAVFMAGLAILVLGFVGVTLVLHDAKVEDVAPASVVEAPEPAIVEVAVEPVEPEPEPEPVAEPEPEPEPVAEPVAEKKEPVRPRATPVTEPDPEPVVVEVEEAPEPRPTRSAPAASTGLLTISSLPRSKVVVDGSFVRYTPLYEHEVAAGAHTIRLETDDGRYTRFRVDVTAGGEVRRIWHFEKGEWVEN